MPRPSNPDAADAVARKRFAADVATLTPTGILNADTTSSASTYTGGARADGALPSSTQRGLVPSVKNMRISYPPAVPHLGGDSSSYAPEPAPNAAEVEAVKKMHRADAAHRSASLSFDLTECSAPLANMLRRLIITEVPTMAIDRVLIEENDSPVPDEMISHRLGLCPIVCPDPDTAFEYVTEHGHVSFTNPDEYRVLCFELDVSVPLDAPIHAVRNVWSSELKWTPLKGQAERLQAHRSKVDAADPFAAASSSGAVDGAGAAAAAPDVVRVVHPDVLLCKLGCGQRLKLRAYAIKGLGAAHAKWSPVAACHYDMQTRVRFERPLSGDLAARLCKLCPGVFEPAAAPDFGPGGGGEVAVRKEAKFRDCGRLFDDKGEDLLPYVRVEKVKDEMRFTLESLGQYRCPTQIVRLALTGFANRLRYLRESVRGAGVKNASVFERLAAEGDEA